MKKKRERAELELLTRHQAATKIQTLQRQRIEKRRQHIAAIKIQSVTRGMISRNLFKKMKEAETKEDKGTKLDRSFFVFERYL